MSFVVHVCGLLGVLC